MELSKTSIMYLILKLPNMDSSALVKFMMRSNTMRCMQGETNASWERVPMWGALGTTTLADYNFSLEYQKGKDNTVVDFLSRVENRLSDEEVEEYATKIPQPGVKVVLNNAGTPVAERAESGVDLQPIRACLAETLTAYPVRLSTLHVTDWKQAQRDDPAIHTVIRNLRSPQERFKEALNRVLDKKAIQAYV